MAAPDPLGIASAILDDMEQPTYHDTSLVPPLKAIAFALVAIAERLPVTLSDEELDRRALAVFQNGAHDRAT